MNLEVIIRPEAELDISDAFHWYEDKMDSLGHRFLIQVDTAIKFITRYPQVAPVEYRGTRKHLLRRFPYKLIYLIENDKIIVLGVIHGKRHPDFAIKRIDKA